jgi:hypothetical protein
VVSHETRCSNSVRPVVLGALHPVAFSDMKPGIFVLLSRDDCIGN